MYRNSGPRTKSTKRMFNPTEAQLETAKRRMLSTLDKHGGATPIRSFADAVDFFCKEVTNRGGELGLYQRGEFKKTIQTALHHLLYREQKIELNESHLRLLVKVKSKRRKHRQKYPSKPRVAFA